MQERGRLIRHALPEEFRKFEGRLRAALGSLGAEMGIDASDGIGLKTEAPWVRIFAKSMSPAATSGFYVVVHFARDGSAVFVTMGCGSNVWKNGDLVADSDQDLATRTGWARSVVLEKFGTLDPFSDKIALGARADLPRTFEKATAVAKRIAVDALDETEFEDLLVAATERLREVYDAQRVGSDLKPTEAAEREIEEIARPVRARAGRQGLRLSAEERRAIELRAMEVATGWLEANGYKVTDKSKNAPYDLQAVMDAFALKVEVKGTTGTGGDDIFMTKNEVDLHIKEKGKTGIIIVAGIQLSKTDGKLSAKGGKVHAEIGWDIEKWSRTPMAFRVSRQSP
jgi:hypothetical protein